MLQVTPDNLESRFRQAPSVMATDVGSTSVVMTDSDLASYFGVESVAAVIWKALVEPATVAGIVEMLLEDYEIDEESCRRETTDFIKTLADRGLVEQTD